MKIPCSICCCILLACCGSHQNPAPAGLRQPHVRIIPFDESIPPAVEYVAQGIRDTLGLEVTILPPEKLPFAAWYSPGKRYKADSILRFLQSQVPDKHTYLLGITGKDISTHKNGNPYWGIMGLGFMPGNCCIVSDYRLHRHPQTAKQLNIRLLKVALHEVGHNLGLPTALTRHA